MNGQRPGITVTLMQSDITTGPAMAANFTSFQVESTSTPITDHGITGIAARWRITIITVATVSDWFVISGWV